MATLKEMADEFLALKTIAVVGLSRRDTNAGNFIYQKLKQSGHTVYAVNPNAHTLEGDACYTDVKSTPTQPDGVVLVTRPNITEQVVRECAEAGVRHVWIHSSIAHGGTSLSQAAVDFCREQGIEVIAGGCPMMFAEPVDFGHKCIKWMMHMTGELPA